MEESMLGTGDVAKLSGMHPNTCMNWANRGWLGKVAHDGRGDGYAKRYTLMQGFSIYCGAAWTRAGFNAVMVESVCRFVSRLSQAALVEHLSRGEVFVIPPLICCGMVLPVGGYLVSLEDGLGLSTDQEDTEGWKILRRLSLDTCWAAFREDLRKLPPTRDRMGGKGATVQLR